MAAQPNEIYRIALNTVDKHQIRFDVAISKTLMIAGQRMIFILGVSTEFGPYWVSCYKPNAVRQMPFGGLTR